MVADEMGDPIACFDIGGGQDFGDEVGAERPGRALGQGLDDELAGVDLHRAEGVEAGEEDFHDLI